METLDAITKMCVCDYLCVCLFVCVCACVYVCVSLKAGALGNEFAKAVKRVDSPPPTRTKMN